MKSVFFVNHAAEYKNIANANAVKKFRIFLDTFQPEMFFSTASFIIIKNLFYHLRAQG
tara:strand:+ start:5401 stop:5574 length:174 start_codon:yes stop_codon:yes gene_type:complete